MALVDISVRLSFPVLHGGLNFLTEDDNFFIEEDMTILPPSKAVSCAASALIQVEGILEEGEEGRGWRGGGEGWRGEEGMEGRKRWGFGARGGRGRNVPHHKVHWDLLTTQHVLQLTWIRSLPCSARDPYSRQEG